MFDVADVEFDVNVNVMINGECFPCSQKRAGLGYVLTLRARRHRRRLIALVLRNCENRCEPGRPAEISRLVTQQHLPGPIEDDVTSEIETELRAFLVGGG